MKPMSWEEYYDGFYEWSPSTQKKYTYRLTGYGPAEEVWEVAQELDFYDSAFAVKFLEKAFDAGVRFTPEQVLEMEGTVDCSFLSRLAEQSDGAFSLEELEDIDGLIDEDSFQKISRQAGIRAVDGEDKFWPEQEVYSAPPKKPGLLATLMALVTGVSPASHSEKKHSRHCDGDCANCRPTTDTAMDGGTMERAISTAASLAAIKAARTEFQRFRILAVEYIESRSGS